MRLNFEFDVECYDCELAAKLYQWMEGKRKLARHVTLADVDGRGIPERLRDGWRGCSRRIFERAERSKTG